MEVLTIVEMEPLFWKLDHHYWKTVESASNQAKQANGICLKMVNATEDFATDYQKLKHITTERIH